MLLKLFRKRVVEGLKAKGMTEADATAAVGQLGDGTILKWLLDGGIEELIQSLLALFALVGTKSAAPPATS